jgi:putative ABC transport system permease protein
LMNNKIHTFINVFGMALAFGASILVFLTAYFELTFNGMFPHKNEIFRVYIKMNSPDKVRYGTAMATPMRVALQADYPQDFKGSSRVMDHGFRLRYKGKVHNEDASFVDADYLKMFDFKFIKGNAEVAMKDLNHVVINETVAQKIFGNENPIGQTIEAEIGEERKVLVVSGVIEKLPDNTNIENNFLVRYELNPTYQNAKDRWNHSNSSLYVQLKDAQNWQKLETRFKGFVNKYFKDGLEQMKKEGAKPDERGELVSLRLLPFTEEHFNKEIGGSGASNIIYTYSLLIISLLILFIASINFINLSIAKALTRAKEVGMRKALGAMKGQIVRQFWGETVLICLFAFGLGLLFFYLFLPQYNAMFRSKLEFANILQPQIGILILLGVLFITLFAGGYPAWFVARFNTIEVLKGKLTAGRSSSIVRNVLIIKQFTFSAILIASTLIIWRQLSFLQKTPLGFNQDHVISIPLGNEMNSTRIIELMKGKLANNSNIMNIAAADNNLGRGKDESGSKSQFGFLHEGKSLNTNGLFVTHDYIKTLGMTIKEGRNFSIKFPTDSTQACIINEAMAKEMGGKNIIGQKLDISDTPKVVIGIIEDYHFETLKNKIEPITLMINGFPYTYAFIKIRPENADQTLSEIGKAYKSIVPNSEFLGSFLDENRANQYRKEKRFSQIFVSSAILAIIISCMGLFAIALIMISRRTKEIGIRKVSGASVSSITLLLSKDFLKLVVVASIIAFPIAYYLMNNWLQDFAYRTEITWWLFVIAISILLSITLLTVGYQSIKAALMNPVKSLKTE